MNSFSFDSSVEHFTECKKTLEFASLLQRIQPGNSQMEETQDRDGFVACQGQVEKGESSKGMKNEQPEGGREQERIVPQRPGEDFKSRSGEHFTQGP